MSGLPELLGVPAGEREQLISLLGADVPSAAANSTSSQQERPAASGVAAICWLDEGFVSRALAELGPEARRRPVVVLVEEQALSVPTGSGWPAHWQWAPWPLTAKRLQHYLHLAIQASPSTPDAASEVPDWASIGPILLRALRGAGMFEFEYDLRTGARQDNVRRQFGKARVPRSIDDMLEFVHPEHRPTVAAAYQRCVESGADFRVRMPVNIDSADYRWIRSVGRVIDRGPQNPGRLVGISWDVHDEHLAKESAVIAQQRLDDALAIGGMVSWEWRRGDRQRRLTGEGPLAGGEAANLDDLICPADRESDAIRFAIAVERGERYHSEVRFKSAGARPQHWLLRGFPRRDRLGSTTAMLGIALDLTEQHELQRDLTEAKRLLQESLEAARMYCWQWNCDDGTAQTLGPCSEMLGEVPADPAGMKPLIHPQDDQQHQSLLREAIASGSIFSNEFRIIRPDGQLRWISTRASPAFDDSGRLVRITGLSIDVTRSRRDREALASAKERLDIALEAAALNPWTVDLETGHRVGGPRDKALFGEQVESLSRFRSLVLDEDRVLTDQVVARALEDCSDTIHVEFRVRHSDGQLRWISSYAKAVRDGSAKPTHLVGISRDISEARDAQEQLAQTLVQLDRVQSATNVVLWEWNRAEGFVGYAAGGIHLRGADLPRLHRDHRWHFLRALLRCSCSEEALDLEVRVSRNSGDYFWVNLKGRKTEFAADGSPIVSGVMIDIADNVRNRVRAARAEERLRNALSAANMRCWDWETERADAAADVLDGYTPLVLAGNGSAPGRVHPDDVERHRGAIAAALSEPPFEYRCEFRVVQPDGRTIWLLSMGKATLESDDRRMRLAGVAIDISAQKELQRQLAESQHWQSIAVEVAELNLWRVDMVTGVRHGGPRDRQLFGFEPQNADQLRELIHPDDLPIVDRAWQACLQGQTDCQADYRVLVPGGRPRWMRVRGRCERDPVSGHAVAIGATREITDQVEAQGKMQNALAQARQASAAKSAFLASVSHELRTPLNAVVGYANLLDDTELEATQREHLKVLRSSAQQLLLLVNDVLDLSRIEAGEMVLERVPFALHECLESALDVVAGDAEAKSLCLLMTSNGDQSPWVQGDPTRLRQVLVNLLSNAVKFTDRGEVVVALQTERRGEQIAIRCTVSDTGIGMSEEVVDSLFQPFRQGDESTTRRYGGTGLGLSISKHLIVAMGGQISCESSPGVGTVFSLALELPGSPSPRSFQRPPGYPRHAGVIAKSAAVRAALRRQLPELGLTCIEVDPQHCVAKLQEDTLCADVLIVGEPALGCLEALQRWPTTANGQPLPVIVLCGIKRSLDPTVGSHGQRQLPVSRALKPSALAAALTSCSAWVTAEALPSQSRQAPKGDKCLSGMQVLVVEDNEINRTLIQLQLELLGVKVSCADSGAEALRLLRKEDYTVVLMDLEMPGMDGLETTRQIRARSDHARRPYIVAVTAHVLSGIRERIDEAGMDDFVSKPVALPQLREALLRAISTVH